MKTGYYTDPVFLLHDTGSHPENAGRLDAISQKIEAEGLLSLLEKRNSRKATEDEICLNHSLDYIRQVEDAVLSGQNYLGTPDCSLSKATYDVALHATGSMLDAISAVDEGKLDNSFVACRPPGHHAEHHQAMGFCFFNNIAIGAAFLTKKLGYKKVLIFDFDVHHGNGTQHSFEHRKDIFFSSIHQHPQTCYPGTGYTEEKGRSEGTGYTLNVPMQPHSSDEDYLQQFNNSLLPAFQSYRPDFILISAGFDAHQDDQLASINLTQNGFDMMIEGMKKLALDCCEGKMVSILEGGYDYRRLSECVASHIKILQADPK